jgi:2-phosphosulfolactate phosphatase
MPAPDLPPPPTFDVPTSRVLAAHIHMHDVAPADLAGCVVIVIDAIRASVTICKALHAGACAVVPVLTAEDARERARGFAQPRNVLLGGERGGVLIEGFDIDNSPFSYTPERVEGKTIVFTTSNGTAGLLHARQAHRVLVGCFSNLSALCERVAEEERPVHILCSGTRDNVSLDDCLPAGAMVEKLVAAGRNLVPDDAARLCLAAWRSLSHEAGAISRAMRESRGGRNLVRIGLESDVDFCAIIDSLPIVPEFDPATGVIRA